MMESGTGACVEGEDEERRLIRELFHELNQPLTSLQCSLELSLQRPRSEEEYRRTLRRALEQAEEIVRLTCGIRDLLQAGDPGPRRRAVAFGGLLREAVSDLQPVAESRQTRLLLEAEWDGEVVMEPQRLRQVLFSMIEFGLERLDAGATAVVQATQQEDDAVIRICSTGIAKPPSNASLNWAIARRLVASASGILQMDSSGGATSIELRMPLAPASANRRPAI